MLKNIQNNPYFSEKTLTTGAYLFREGETDEHIYIIEHGTLIIEKELEDNQKKYLADLQPGDIFGEGGLSGNFQKNVSIQATKNTKLFCIRAQDFEDFTKIYPKVSQDFLTQIIYLSNDRLLKSNELVIKSYELAKLVAQATDFSNTTLFTLLQKLKEKLKCDTILFFERNPVLKNYVSFRYTSDEPNKMKDEVFEIQTLDIQTLKSIKIQTKKYTYIAKLTNNSKNIGYLVFENEKSDFSELTRKVIDSLSITLAGYMKQKQNIENI